MNFNMFWSDENEMIIRVKMTILDEDLKDLKDMYPSAKIILESVETNSKKIVSNFNSDNEGYYSNLSDGYAGNNSILKKVA